MLFALLLFDFTYAASQKASTCVETSPGEITYAWEVNAVATGDGTVIQTRFNLIGANKPLLLGVLAFHNGIQLDTLKSQASVKCGGEVILSFDADQADASGGLMHIFPRWLPVVPDEIRSSDPSHKLSGSDIFKFGTRLADGYVLGAGGMIQANKLSPRSSYALVPSADSMEHLSTEGNPVNPTYIKYLDKGVRKMDFNVVLGETSDEQLAYTITCLLDNKQIAAFSGQRTWTGELQKQQAAIVEASTSKFSTGWHKLECLVLNGSVRGYPERFSEFPHQIHPLFFFAPSE